MLIVSLCLSLSDCVPLCSHLLLLGGQWSFVFISIVVRWSMVLCVHVYCCQVVNGPGVVPLKAQEIRLKEKVPYFALKVKTTPDCICCVYYGFRQDNYFLISITMMVMVNMIITASTDTMF